MHKNAVLSWRWSFRKCDTTNFTKTGLEFRKRFEEGKSVAKKNGNVFKISRGRRVVVFERE